MVNSERSDEESWKGQRINRFLSQQHEKLQLGSVTLARTPETQVTIVLP